MSGQRKPTVLHPDFVGTRGRVENRTMSFLPRTRRLSLIDRFLTRLTSRAAAKTVMNGAWIDTNGDKDTDAGEFVEYQLLVVNVGTVTLNSIALIDGSVYSEDISCVPSLPNSLIPGEDFKCEATYMVSEA